MEKLEYITSNAIMQCSNGSVPGIFTSTHNQTVKINKCKVATEADKEKITNIPSFVVCKKTRKCCTPIPTKWENTYPVQVKGQKTLIGQSCMTCGVGGKIEFLSSGQVPLTSEEENELHKIRKEVQDAFEEEQEEENKSGLQKAGEVAVDMIPVVGPAISLFKNIRKGNWGMAVLDVVFLGVDAFSVITAIPSGGTSVAGAAAAKAGVRGIIKVGERKIAKKVSKEAIEAGAKKTTELLSKLSVRSLTGGRLCVFACFPAGTPVATKDGLRNIEDIRRGDEVWAYDEKTGETGLKPVVNHFERQANILVRIEVNGEIIRATPEHPFYVNGEWKEAGLLETGDSIMLFSGKLAKVNEVNYEGAHAPVEINNIALSEPEVFNQKSTKVLNFEVEGWHTYFVGWMKVLVHNNSEVCIKGVVKATLSKFRKPTKKNKNIAHTKTEYHSNGSITFYDKKGNSVIYKNGYPDFSKYALVTTKIKGLTGYSIDITVANRLSGFLDTPKGYVWHHVEDKLSMQLIPEKIHNVFQHSGGASLLRKTSKLLNPLIDKYNFKNIVPEFISINT